MSDEWAETVSTLLADAVVQLKRIADALERAHPVKISTDIHFCIRRECGATFDGPALEPGWSVSPVAHYKCPLHTEQDKGQEDDE